MSVGIVSVAICTFNGEKYIREQIDSIVNQTKPPNQIIICDDGSTDNTVSILEEYRNNYKSCGIKIYVNKVNLGSTKNFEQCIKLCNGDIIFLSDQDDRWERDKIEKVVKVFEGNSKIGLVFTNAYITDEQGNLYKHKLWDASRCSEAIIERIQGEDAFEIFLRKNFATGGTMAFCKELVEQIIPIPKSWVQDHYIAMVAAAVSKISPLNDSLIYYRQHKEQQIGGAKNKFLQKVILRLTAKKNEHRKYMVKVVDAKEILYSKNILSDAQTRIIEDFSLHMDNREHIVTLPLLKRFFKIVFALRNYLKYVDGFYDAVSDLLKV